MPPLKNAQIYAQQKQAKHRVTTPSSSSTEDPVESLVEPEENSGPEFQDEDSSTETEGTEIENVKLNVNLATAEELIALPHIDAKRSTAIIKKRASGYTDLADLKAKAGITLSDAQWQELETLLDFELPQP